MPIIKAIFLALSCTLLFSGCVSNKPVRFALVADPQLEFTEEDPKIDREYLDLTIHEINDLDPPADFALILGDMVNNSGSESQWADYFEAMEAFEIPYYEVMGNHDGWYPEGVERWRETWQKADYYTFTHKGLFFIGLNSYFLKHPEELPKESKAQRALITEEIEAHADNPHKFVFQHYPMYLEDENEPEGKSSNLPLSERRFLLDIIEEQNVIAHFNGHRHYEIDREHKGTRLLSGNPSSRTLGNGKRGYYIVDYTKKSQLLEIQFIENTESKLAAFQSGQTNHPDSE